METAHFFGEYDHIYFLMSGWTITGLCDRARRAETLAFTGAELVDLAGEPRPLPTLVVDSQDRPYMIMPNGFGRTLRYERVEPTRNAALAARLRVDLPERALYRVGWSGLGQDGDTFELAPGVGLTIDVLVGVGLAAAPWTAGPAATFVRDDGTRTHRDDRVTLLAPDRADVHGPALAVAHRPARVRRRRPPDAERRHR